MAKPTNKFRLERIITRPKIKRVERWYKLGLFALCEKANGRLIVRPAYDVGLFEWDMYDSVHIIVPKRK